jgi:hypothetical protein
VCPSQAPDFFMSVAKEKPAPFDAGFDFRFNATTAQSKGSYSELRSRYSIVRRHSRYSNYSQPEDRSVVRSVS